MFHATQGKCCCNWIKRSLKITAWGCPPIRTVLFMTARDNFWVRVYSHYEICPSSIASNKETSTMHYLAICIQFCWPREGPKQLSFLGLTPGECRQHPLCQKNPCTACPDSQVSKVGSQANARQEVIPLSHPLRTSTSWLGRQQSWMF